MGSKPAQFYIRLSIILLSQQANHISLGIIRHHVVAFVCLHFCLTGYQSAQLNSFEELCIMQVAAINSFARVFNPLGEKEWNESDNIWRRKQTKNIYLCSFDDLLVCFYLFSCHHISTSRNILLPWGWLPTETKIFLL